MNKLNATQKVLTSSAAIAAAVVLPITQLNAVSASYSPISAPISAPISSPVVTPTPEPTSAPVSSPEVTPEPSATLEPTQTPSDNGNNNSGSNDSHSDNNSGGSSAPSCNAEKPKAPYLTAWEKTGPNQVTLHWTKPQGNVNYYSVSYGLKSHSPLYGNPSVGNSNTTSTVINGLSGTQTYYFTLEAGNDCVHSDASNELVVKINGVKLNTPVSGFSQKSVLSASKSNQPKVTQNNQNSNSGESNAQNQVSPKPATPGFFGNIANFFGNFFRH